MNGFKKSISFALAILLIMQWFPAIHVAASGTESNPIMITSVADLKSMGTTGYYKLANDIDLSGETHWQPIGNYDFGTDFNGTFDGNGYTIRNLTVNNPGYDGGLFGSIAPGGVVKNLNLENVNVTGIFANSDYGYGAVAGWNSGRIEHVNVKVKKIESYANVGGIAGWGDGTIAYAAVEPFDDSSFLRTTAGPTNGGSIGGIIGRNQGIIEYARSAIRVTTTSSGAGGIAGHNDPGYGAVIRYSYNTGDIFAYNTAGGLVGNGGNVENSYSTGNVTGSVALAIDNSVGGIFGYFNGRNSFNLYSTGSVTISSGGAAGGGFLGISNPGVGNTAILSRSFWDMESSGNSVSSGNNDNGKNYSGVLNSPPVGLSTAAMKNPATYAGWPEDVWEIKDGEYPTLKALAPAPAQDSTVSPDADSFDKYSASVGYRDAATTLSPNGNTLIDILLGGSTIGAANYTYDAASHVVAIKKEYLALLGNGPHVFTFDMSAGADPTFTVTVGDSTPPPPQNSTLNPDADSFDKYSASVGYRDAATTLSPNGNTLIDILLGGSTIGAANYTYDAASHVVAIKKEYLALLGNGPHVFTFDMSAGADPTFTVTVGDSTPPPPQNSTLNPDADSFDKYSASVGYRDAATTLSPNGNTLIDILLGGSTIGAANYTYDAASHVVAIKKEYLALLGNGPHVFTFDMSAGADPTFTVTVGDSTPPPPRTDGSTSGPSGPSAPENAETAVEVIVNGKAEMAGKAKTDTVNGQKVTTIEVDEVKLQKRLKEEGQGALIIIPIETESDAVIGELNGHMVKNMETQQAVVQIRTERATYTLPALQIDIEAVSKRFGSNLALQDIKVKIEIAEPPAGTIQVVESAAKQGGFTLMAAPLNFKVSAEYGGRIEEISQFNAYVERSISIPEGVDPNKITTGVVVEPDGAVRHVPTKVMLIDGRHYAQINSLTNSTYSIVWNPLEFNDMTNHWAKTAVNDMGSRMVIGGTGNGLFYPEIGITRAEFAAIIVRGLGLKLEHGKSPFSDVESADWYSSAIQTAYAYRLISGFEDGTFRPNETITREQAMVILSRAMEITGLKSKLPFQPWDAALRSRSDLTNVSEWALSSVAECVQAGIVTGRSGNMLAPREMITRAEAAVMIERLLKQSELI